jgi:uncharacterized repeat protein (TIGR03803 family)
MVSTILWVFAHHLAARESPTTYASSCSEGRKANWGPKFEFKKREETMKSLSVTQTQTALILGVLTMLLGVLPIPSAQAQTFTTLYTFTGGTDGAFPYAQLIRDKAGNLYGTAARAGLSGGCGGQGCGTVFKLDPSNNQTVIYTFTGTDGVSPYASLFRDAAGNLYGTTYYGGTKGLGAVFRISTAGKETVAHSFRGLDGEYPQGGLVADSSGNHYGLTYAGGAASVNCGGSVGCGTIYKLDKKNKETVLYTFTGGPDGGGPYYESLVRDSAGNFYGTTDFGGFGCNVGCGVIFKFDTTGQETVLYTFTGLLDGANPSGGLVRDSAGDLYGTTRDGGLPNGCINGYGCGTVFKLSASGSLTTLYSFTGGADGGNPFSSLIRDSAGNLYGTTYAGAFGYGTIFKLDKNGNETTLYEFTGGADGGQPIAGLIRDSAGNLYGATVDRGSTGCTGVGCGTIFKLTP